MHRPGRTFGIDTSIKFVDFGIRMLLPFDLSNKKRLVGPWIDHDMPATAKTTYTRYTLAAVHHLGQLVKLKRIERRISAAELAQRLGVARGTLQRLERGDTTIALGIAFEACSLLSIPLFEEDRSRLTARIEDIDKRLALLPKAARARAVKLDDDF